MLGFFVLPHKYEYQSNKTNNSTQKQYANFTNIFYYRIFDRKYSKP